MKETNFKTPNQLKSSSELSQQLVKKIAKAGGTVLAGQSLGKVVNFILHIVLGRFLGSGGYGLYSLGFTIFNIQKMISLFGMEGGIVRFVSHCRTEGDSERVKGTLISSFLFCVALSIIAAVVTFLLSDLLALHVFNKPELSFVIKIFSISLPFYVVFTIACFSLRAFERVGYEATVKNIFFPIANFLIVILAFFLGFRLGGALFGFAGSALLSAISGLFLLNKIFPELVSNLNTKFEWKRLLRFTLPLMLAGSSYLLMTYTDKIMLGYFTISEELGIYTAAFKIVALLGAISTAFKPIYAPVISSLYSEGNLQEVGKIYKLTTRWFFTISLFVLLVFTLFSSQIMGIFGKEFEKGGLLLIVLGIFGFLSACTGLTGVMMGMLELQDFALFNNTGAFLINILLNFFLIMQLGALGAAIATGITKALVSIAETGEVRLIRGIHPFSKKYLKPLTSGAVSVGLIALVSNFAPFKLPWLIYVALMGLCYILCLFLLGLEKEDQVILRSIKGKMVL